MRSACGPAGRCQRKLPREARCCVGRAGPASKVVCRTSATQLASRGLRAEDVAQVVLPVKARSREQGRDCGRAAVSRSAPSQGVSHGCALRGRCLAGAAGRERRVPGICHSRRCDSGTGLGGGGRLSDSPRLWLAVRDRGRRHPPHLAGRLRRASPVTSARPPRLSDSGGLRRDCGRARRPGRAGGSRDAARGLAAGSGRNRARRRRATAEFDRGAPLCQHQQRSRQRLLLRRHLRGDPERAVRSSAS